MSRSDVSVLTPQEKASLLARRLVPGVLLAMAVAVASFLLEPLIGRLLATALGTSYSLPAIVIALVVGIALNPWAARPAFEPGLTWCVKRLLRVAIALLGVRIALSDIVDLGFAMVVLVAAAMGLTLLAGVWLARLLKIEDGAGALAGAATAVCGASATLATASVLPHYPQKGADVAFTVVAANAVSTLVMVAYPVLAASLDLDPRATGILLGATIHDMAQVVGAGYAVSEPVGNTAVIVKLFRVFLLLPVVLAIGWWMARPGIEQGTARVPVPVFALGFLGLCLLNSLMPQVPALLPLYLPLRTGLIQASAWGLLIAIAALGLGTSLASLLRIGWRHMAVFTGATLVLLVTVVVGLRFA